MIRHLLTILLLSAFLMTGCAHEDRAAEAKKQQDELTDRYPDGSTRSSIMHRYGTPADTAEVGAGTILKDASAAEQLKLLGPRAASVRRFDRYIVPRRPPDSKIGALGFNWDYLFYDADDHLVAAKRRVID